MAGGRPRIYPWEVWLDGQRRLLQAGRDFRRDVVTRNLRNQIYAEARRRGQRVSVETYGDGGLVVHAGPAARRSSGRPERYDWHKLFDGDAHVLRAGVDFPRGDRENFRRTVRRAADRYGVAVRTKVVGSLELRVIGGPILPDDARYTLPIMVDYGVDEDSTFDVPPWPDGDSGEQDGGLADQAAGSSAGPAAL